MLEIGGEAQHFFVFDFFRCLSCCLLFVLFFFGISEDAPVGLAIDGSPSRCLKL